MKKYILIASLAFAGVFTSCDVERLPGDGIAIEESFQTLDDVELFRTGLYSGYRSSNYNGRRILSDFQVDIVNAVADYGNRKGLLYTWQDGMATDYDIEDYYELHYITISNINNFLENIDEIEIEDSADIEKIQRYKGEAHLMRASLFHNLVRYFAKAYNPASANTDLGIAIPLEYDPTGKPARATMAETYNQIQKDLDAAKSMLPDESQAMSIYLTKDFAHAIQARVSLEKHDFQEAINAADLIIPKYALASSSEALESLWKNDDSSEILVKLYTSLQEGRSAVTQFINFTYSSRKYTPDFVLSKKAVDLYEDNDFRKEVFITEEDILISGSTYEDVKLLNKYPGNPDYDSNSNFSDYVNAPKLFMIAEAYLIKAEAQARGQIGDAITTLNELRAARGATPLTSGDAFDLVKEERLREMIGEGQRLLDLKRWGEDLKRTGAQDALSNNGLYIGGSDAPNLSKPANDKMWVWEIPIRDLNTNDNMKPNW